LGGSQKTKLKQTKKMNTNTTAAVFGCTQKQVSVQLEKNRAQLLAMADKAKATGKPVKGYSEIQLRIMAASVGTAPGTKERNKACASVKWVLRSGSAYIGKLDAALNPTLTSNKASAVVFDGRDNEETKARFYSLIMGAPFTPELL